MRITPRMIREAAEAGDQAGKDQAMGDREDGTLDQRTQTSIYAILAYEEWKRVDAVKRSVAVIRDTFIEAFTKEHQAIRKDSN